MSTCPTYSPLTRRLALLYNHARRTYPACVRQRFHTLYQSLPTYISAATCADGSRNKPSQIGNQAAALLRSRAQHTETQWGLCIHYHKGRNGCWPTKGQRGNTGTSAHNALATKRYATKQKLFTTIGYRPLPWVERRWPFLCDRWARTRGQPPQRAERHTTS